MSTASNVHLGSRPRLQGLKLPSPKMSYDTEDMKTEDNLSETSVKKDNPLDSESADNPIIELNAQDAEPSADNPIIESRAPSELNAQEAEPSADNPIIDSRAPSEFNKEDLGKS